MEQRLSLVTLAARDVEASKAFYARLGWKPVFEGDDIAFYQLNGVAFSVWNAAAMAAETGRTETPGGIALAYNVREKAAVESVQAEAKAAGATIKDAVEREWGGTSGHFIDPDGHLWEVAHNPFWPIDDTGDVTVPSAP